MAATALRTARKLGVRAGSSVVLLGAPERFCARFETEVEATLADVKVARQLRPAPVDCVVLFVSRLHEIEGRIGKVGERLHPDGHIWIAWRSRRAGDIDEDVVRRIGLTQGMVASTAVAIDAVWSGIRLTIRHENRDALAYRLLGRPSRRTRRATPPPPFTSGAGSGLATARARRRT